MGNGIVYVHFFYFSRVDSPAKALVLKAITPSIFRARLGSLLRGRPLVFVSYKESILDEWIFGWNTFVLVQVISGIVRTHVEYHAYVFSFKFPNQSTRRCASLLFQLF